MQLIKERQFFRQHPSALAYSIQLYQDNLNHYIVYAGITGQETPRNPAQWGEAQAQLLFDTLIAARQAEGFLESQHSPIPSCEIAVYPNSPLDRLKAALLKRLHPDHWRTLPLNKRMRVVWQIGEHRIAEAIPFLISQLNTRSGMLDYCLIWAIGRCNRHNINQEYAPLLLEQYQNQTYIPAKNLALAAWLDMVPDAQKENFIQSKIQAWPKKLAAAWLEQDIEKLTNESFLIQYDIFQYIVDLDALSTMTAHRDFARQVLEKFINYSPLVFNFFKAFRYLYKITEFRGDAHLFGLVHFRLENQRENLRRSSTIYINRKFVAYDEAKTNPKYKLAYTDKTRLYLRRRTWRNLHRLARYGSPEFIAMALGILSAFKMPIDVNQKNNEPVNNNEKINDQYFSDEKSRRKYLKNQYLKNNNKKKNANNNEPPPPPAFFGWLLLYKLLYSNGERWKVSDSGVFYIDPYYKGQVVFESALHAPREEAYPECWQQQPAALLWLIHYAEFYQVRNFAARILFATPECYSQISQADIIQLLHSDYFVAKDLAVKIIFSFIKDNNNIADVLPWLILILGVPLNAEQSQFIFYYISQHTQTLCYSSEFIAALIGAVVETNDSAENNSPENSNNAITNPIYSLSKIILDLSKYNKNVLKDVVQIILHRLESTEKWDKYLNSITKNILNSAQHYFIDSVENSELQRIIALLYHPSHNVVELAGRWLALYPSVLLTLPDGTLSYLLQSSQPNNVATGVFLLSQLPETVLLSYPSLVIQLAQHPQAQIREAMLEGLQLFANKPQITQTQQWQTFSENVSSELISSLFYSEKSEGIHKNVITILQTCFKEICLTISQELHLQLLMAQSHAAQDFAGWLLNYRQTSDFSVKQWADFARCNAISIRQWVYQSYKNNPDIIADNMDSALRIFDSRWEDAIDFGVEYFQHHGKWTPQLLIEICDHTQSKVQALGKVLMQKHTDIIEIIETLMQLSQHPSLQIQELVGEWLSEIETPSLQQLQQLKPYFITILSQVNKARIIKNKVIELLKNYSKQSEECAVFVAEIFNRQIVTMAITDKADYLQGLYEIQQQYPHLPPSLHIIAPRAAQVNSL